MRLRAGLLFGLPHPACAACSAFRKKRMQNGLKKGNVMKSIRWSIHFSCLIALALALTLVDARADQNSVALENATGGPFAAFNGSGQVIGQIEPGVPDSSHVYFVSQNFQSTNIFNQTTPWPSLVDGHPTEVAG